MSRCAPQSHPPPPPPPQHLHLSIRVGVTYMDLVSTVGIHPTCAEEVVKLRITRASGEDPTVSAC